MASTAERYRGFARDAEGRSPQYVELASAVAEDDEILGLLSALPSVKRQPNLLFASARYLLDGEPATIDSLRGLLAERRRELVQVILNRRTQTNEPARCAAFLPVLAGLPQPLALIEVGASAGLTLLPDRYSYDYRRDSGPGPGSHQVTGTESDAPVLTCRVTGPAPLPPKVPEIAWRAGLDLNPLDVSDEDDVHWLRCLIWPGETGRRERLNAAVEIARRDPPVIHRGDLLTDLPALARQAPADATLVVFHSAVLIYVAPQDRGTFARTMQSLDAVWLSNEAPGIVVSPERRDGDHFVLAQNGQTPLAFTDGHGTWLDWLP